MSLVSVIIPTYNRNDLLFGRALPSLVAQTHSDIEVLIVADGMEGAELEELEERTRDLQFSCNFPLRLWNIDRFPYPEHQHMRWGLSGVAARNFGLDHARGDFIAALDDDDAMLPDAIGVLLGELLVRDVDFVYGISETLKGDPPVRTGQKYGRAEVGDGAFCHGAFVYRASLGYRYAIDCFDRARTADSDLWTRMREDGVRFHFLPRHVHDYYRNYP